MENVKQTQFYEPQIHSNVSTEIKIKKGVYSRDVRLANVGVYPYIPTGDNGIYPRIGGVLQLIKNIHFYDGTQLISETLNVYRLAPFLNLQHSNAENVSADQMYNYSGLGFTYESNSVYANMDGADLGNITLSLVNVNDILPFFNAVDIDTFTKIKSAKKKKESLKLLHQSELRMDIFENPRLVIDWNYDIPWSYQFPGAADTDNVTFNRPLLIMEKYMDDSEYSNKNVTLKYFEYESENLSLKDIAEKQDQVLQQRLRGLENRYVHKVYFKKFAPFSLGNDDNLSKGSESLAQYNEQINFKFNSSEFFPQMIDTDAKQSYVRETAGLNSNTLPFGNQLSCGGHRNVAAGGHRYIDNTKMLSSFAHFALDIEDYVSNAEIIYQRTGFHSNMTGAHTDQSLTLNLFYLTEAVYSNGNVKY